MQQDQNSNSEGTSEESLPERIESAHVQSSTVHDTLIRFLCLDTVEVITIFPERSRVSTGLI